jgi:hypothetical protein
MRSGIIPSITPWIIGLHMITGMSLRSWGTTNDRLNNIIEAIRVGCWLERWKLPAASRIYN